MVVTKMDILKAVKKRVISRRMKKWTVDDVGQMEDNKTDLQERILS